MKKTRSEKSRDTVPLKVVKALWDLISKPIGFLKKSMSPQDTGRQLLGNPGVFRLIKTILS
jgi:hypothetical protein